MWRQHFHHLALSLHSRQLLIVTALVISPDHLLDPTIPSPLPGTCVPATAGTHAELLVCFLLLHWVNTNLHIFYYCRRSCTVQHFRPCNTGHQKTNARYFSVSCEKRNSGRHGRRTAPLQPSRRRLGPELQAVRKRVGAELTTSRGFFLPRAMHKPSKAPNTESSYMATATIAHNSNLR